MLALRFGWTKQQVDAQPRDYIRDLITALRAERDHAVRTRNEQAAKRALEGR